MKKAFLLMTFCFLAIIVVAQKSKFEWGNTVGINMSTIEKYVWQRTDVPLEDPQKLFGRQVGLVFRYRFTPTWAIRTDVQLVEKGWKGQTDVASPIDFVGMTSQQIQDFYIRYYERLYAAQKNRLSYLTVPVCVEYSFWKQRLYAQISVYWGVLLDSPWYQAPKTSDWGAMVGLGFRQPINNHWLISFETRYSHGFSQIYNSVSNSGKLPEQAQGNRCLAANIGFIFTK
jgi:hypothetical protein